mgnify:CR=1 FL=1
MARVEGTWVTQVVTITMEMIHALESMHHVRSASGLSAGRPAGGLGVVLLLERAAAFRAVARPAEPDQRVAARADLVHPFRAKGRPKLECVADLHEVRPVPGLQHLDNVHGSAAVRAPTNISFERQALAARGAIRRAGEFQPFEVGPFRWKNARLHIVGRVLQNVACHWDTVRFMNVDVMTGIARRAVSVDAGVFQRRHRLIGV